MVCSAHAGWKLTKARKIWFVSPRVFRYSDFHHAHNHRFLPAAEADMKPAFQRDDAFLTDVRRVLKTRGRWLGWLGQSGFLIVQNGRAIVLDPYLSESLTRKYATTDKPHTRMTERVVDPAALASLNVIDLITSSHNHTDHFDPETLTPLLLGNPQARLVIPAANRDSALERLGCEFAPRLLELDDSRSAKIAGMTISAVSAAHPTVERDQAGRCRFLGYVV